MDAHHLECKTFKLFSTEATRMTIQFLWNLLSLSRPTIHQSMVPYLHGSQSDLSEDAKMYVLKLYMMFFKDPRQLPASLRFENLTVGQLERLFAIVSFFILVIF